MDIVQSKYRSKYCHNYDIFDRDRVTEDSVICHIMVVVVVVTVVVMVVVVVVVVEVDV